jgi:hypothetical protein
MNSNILEIKTVNISSLLRMSIGSLILQLLSILAGAIVLGVWGIQANSALSYFETMQESIWIGFLMDDIFSITLVALYLFTFLGIFYYLARIHLTLSLVGVMMIFTAVVFCVTAHSGFSMLFLGERYWATTDEVTRQQLLAAGEAVIARNLWHSTPGFFSGLFLQGGGLLLSLVMLHSPQFGKVTAISGIIANGLDLCQHVLGHFRFPVPDTILYIAGPLYIIWFAGMLVDAVRMDRSLQVVSNSLKEDGHG